MVALKAVEGGDDKVCGLILLSGGPDGPIDPLFAQGKKTEAAAALSAMKTVQEVFDALDAEAGDSPLSG